MLCKPTEAEPDALPGIEFKDYNLAFFSDVGQRPHATNSDYEPTFLEGPSWNTMISCFRERQRLNKWTDRETETGRGDLGVGKMAPKFPTKWERNVLEKAGFDL